MALCAVPRGEAEPAPIAAPVLEAGSHDGPLPFLGSGGVVVQVPATQPASALPLLRSGGSGQLPPAAASAARRARAGAALPFRDRIASIKACRLGTPPPQPRSGRAERQADPEEA